MSERKVISKYIPPSHVKLPQSLTNSTTIQKPKKNNQSKVRMMAPMTMRCVTCGGYVYAGTKFNSRKESVPEEKYLGIMVYRFYQRCKICGSEFTFKTDPRNQAYVAELGCVPSYEPWKEARERNMELQLDEMEQELEDEDLRTDAIKELEKKAMQQKKEMEMMDRLDELKALQDEKQTVDIDEVLRRRDERERMRGEERASAAAAEDDDEFTEEQKEKMRRLFGARVVNAELGAGEEGNSKTPTTTTTTTTAAARPRDTITAAPDALIDTPDTIAQSEEAAAPTSSATTSTTNTSTPSAPSFSLSDDNTRKRKQIEREEENLFDALIVEQPATKRRRVDDAPAADNTPSDAPEDALGLFAGYSSD